MSLPVRQGIGSACVLAPLPVFPPVVLEGSLQALYEQALLSCNRLDGVTSLLLGSGLLLYVYVLLEVLIS